MAIGPVLDYWRSRAEKPAALVRDWTQQELAQFYRVEWALSQAGISVDTDRGLSDEGDPWFAFCRASDAEVVVHIAREGQTYLLAGFLSDRIQRGRDFGQLVERLLAEHPAKSIDKRGESNVVMHPATLLALLVSIAFLQSNEGKAETPADHSDEAAPLRVAAPQPLGTGGSLRSIATLSGSVVTLAATFELAQAMTILRVANLMNQVPADHAETQSDMSDSVGGDSGWIFQAKRGSAPDRDLTDQTHLADTHAASALDMSLAPPSSTHAGVEKLLEIVAKLWTFPDIGAATPSGLGVSAALAFFSGTSSGLAENSIEARAHQQALISGEPPLAADLARHAGAADQGSGASTLTIVHTPGSSDTIAQTMLKLSFADQGEVTIKTTTLADTAKLISAVGEIVAHAKTELLSVLGPAGSLLGQSGIEIVSVAGPLGTDKVSLELKAEGKVVAEGASSAVPVEKAYTTTVADGAIKHDVLNDAGHAAVERAIAAFKEDVAHYSIAVSGKDVIFYSPDAVINHSPEVVVELWQFKDGSSIALVGLSVDGHLPYSL